MQNKIRGQFFSGSPVAIEKDGDGVWRHTPDGTPAVEPLPGRTDFNFIIFLNKPWENSHLSQELRFEVEEVQSYKKSLRTCFRDKISSKKGDFEVFLTKRIKQVNFFLAKFL